jgi:glycosyltransferase involved in cell wall biosynthesis
MEKLPITVITLTHDDEKMVEPCLESVKGWVEEIFVVDDYSRDKTPDIVKKYTANIHQHNFEDYSAQRNWALDNLPIKTSWILAIDADQRITPEFKAELFRLFESGEDAGVSGYMGKTRTVFMGRWIRHGGHYPIYRVYLLRKDKARWEDRKYHQHCIVEGITGKLDGDVIDIIAGDLKTFVNRIGAWSFAEAAAAMEDGSGRQIRPRLLGNDIERKRWLRTKLYWRLPLFFRTFAYFFYRYILRLGFLDGTEGLIFHVIQGFYIHFITDAAIYERLVQEKSKERDKR